MCLSGVSHTNTIGGDLLSGAHIVKCTMLVTTSVWLLAAVAPHERGCPRTSWCRQIRALTSAHIIRGGVEVCGFVVDVVVGMCD